MSNHSHISSPLPSCFRPAQHHPTAPEPATATSTNPHLSTAVYQTELGLFSLAWSRTAVFGRSLDLQLFLHRPLSTTADDSLFPPSLSPSLSSSVPSFHLHVRPFIFWNKHGSKKLTIATTATDRKTVQVFWDLSRAKFGPRPEPESGYYIAVVVDGQLALLVGDSVNEAFAKTRVTKTRKSQALILRREHVYGHRSYTTKASFEGRTRSITIDCRLGDDPNPRLCFSVDQKRVLRIKHLKWKFRGNERIEIDGVKIQVSWDVKNWFFEEDEDGYALFMFRFPKLGLENAEDELTIKHLNDNGGNVFGYEEKKMKKKGLLRTARRSFSSSSSSLSSTSSGCGSVMEWESVEENELKEHSGFSLLVYAWKK
ncbi:hypothetical protein NMG60_11000993 [Bertholletia excelsa]